MIIGLTGQTGSGKSTVSAILKEKGYYICDCDAVSREVMADGTSLLFLLAQAFGEEICQDNHLNRNLLAELAFKDKASTELLNSITHPSILKRCEEHIHNAFRSGYKYAVLDAPTLFESGGDKMCDIVVSVCAPESERLKRILQRDNISVEQAKARMKIQKSEEFFMEKSDFVIKNYPPYDLNRQVEDLIKQIEKKNGC